MSNPTLTKTLTATALLAAFVGGAALISSAATAKDGYEKCAGVAKAGQNDCANGLHTCAGQAKKDNDAKEWKYVKIGECVNLGGKVVTESK